MDFKNALIFTPAFTFQLGCFSVKDGRFADVLGQEEPGAVDLNGALVIPGLIDIHTHGAAGADFSDGDEAGLRRMAAHNAKNGVTAFLPTSMTLPYEDLSKAFTVGRKVMVDRRPGEARVMGFNMEGPFLSEKKKGAQNGAYLRDPDPAAFRALFADSGRAVKLVDIAPELPGAEAFAREISPLCKVSVAHTDADYDQAAALFDAGASHLTHLYHAMPSIHHRAPGPIAAAAEREDVMAEVICDGIHSHPAAVRLAFRLFPDRVCLISDSMRGCGMPEGDYDLGGLPVHIEGRSATLPDGTLAGSVTNLYDCMTTALSFGIPRETAVRAATWAPAKAVDLLDELGTIENGKRADFVVCGADLTRKAVYLDGEKL